MNLREVLQSNKYVLIDFYSDDCPPCKLIEQEISKVKLELDDAIDIFQIDQKKNKDVFEAFKVMGLPHLKLFKFGKPIWSYTGLVSKKDIILEINKRQ